MSTMENQYSQSQSHISQHDREQEHEHDSSSTSSDGNNYQSASTGDSSMGNNGNNNNNNGNFDTALLETIFYNEMMQMGGADGGSSSSLSPDFLAYLSADPLTQVSSSGVGDASAVGDGGFVETAPADDSALAERALLSDFGVLAPPTIPQQQQQPPPQQQAPPPLPVQSAPLIHAPPTTGIPHPTQQPPAPFHTDQAQLQPPLPPQPLPQQALALPSQPLPQTSVTTSTSQPPTPLPTPLPTATAPSSSSSSNLVLSQEGPQQLVSQFAAIAQRLGVSLPTTLLKSLTAAAAARMQNQTKPHPVPLPSGNGHATATINNNNGAATATIMLQQAPAGPSIPPVVGPDVIARGTAEAAIAAVTETRKRAAELAALSQDSRPSEATATAAAASSASTTKPPSYSKRRKKPRLADCESKLASLRAENEVLKRHLDNVTNQSKKFLLERRQAEHALKTLFKEKAGPEQINPVISKFSEMYSDYGRHRHHELSFHLQQLEK